MDECIDAAGREWEPYWQRKLLSVSWFNVLDRLRSDLCGRVVRLGCEVWLGILGSL